MFERLWGFAKRHKKKLIFTGVVAGGSYVAYKVYLPRLQDHLLQKLLKDDGLKQFLGELEKLGQEGAGEKESPQVLFAHKQQVSDKEVRKALTSLLQKHLFLFSCEELSENLRKAQTKEEKLACFKALQAESLSKAASALYVLHALLILSRIEFNIVGREINAARAANGDEKKDGDAHTAFLDTTRYLKEDGLQRIADAVRRAVDVCSQRAKLTPTGAVTTDQMEAFFIDVFKEANGELLSKERSVETFLPASIDQEASEPHRELVKRYLDEARDYLESPQLLEVFEIVTAGAAKRVSGMLSEKTGEKDAPIAEGKSVALGKLSGFFIELSSNCLKDEDASNEFVSLFAAESKVNQFCEGVYFQS